MARGQHGHSAARSTLRRRILRKAPGFSAVALLIVAIGIGASATILSIVDTGLFYEPYPVWGRWVAVRVHYPKQNLVSYFYSVPEYRELKQQTLVFEAMGAIRGVSMALNEGNYPERVQGTYISHEIMPMLQIPPLMGRVFRPEDDLPGAAGVTVISYETWQERFHADPHILGHVAKLDGQPYTVVGVMPPHYELWGGNFYVPMRLNLADNDRSARSFWVVGILKAGLSDKRANALIHAAAQRMQMEYAGQYPEYTGLDFDLWHVQEAVTAGVRPSLMVLLAAVALLLLISTSNVANLLLVRAAGRAREMAIRAALGARTSRIVRQLFAESILLAGCGGLLGLLLALWGIPAIVAFVPGDYLPNSSLIHLTPASVSISLSLCVMMSALFSFAPILHFWRPDLQRALKEGTRSSGDRQGRRARNLMITAEIALATVVISGAGLMIRSYRALLNLDVGFRTDHMLTLSLSLPERRYPGGEAISRFYDDLLLRLKSSPVIDSSALVTGRPMADRTVDLSRQDFSIVGADTGALMNANFRLVTPGYFRAMGVKLINGRGFSEADNATAPAVIVINQTMARLFWPKSNPIGQRVRFGNIYSRDGGATPAGATATVVGIAADAKQVDVINAPVRQEFYVPLAQRPELARSMTLVVRSNADAAGVTFIVRHEVAGMDSELPVFGVFTMQRVVSDSFGPKRITTLLLGLFAVLALGLATVGLHGIIGYSVSQRTREIGIRMALGADARRVLRMVLEQGLMLAAIGVAAGLTASAVVTRLLTKMLYGVTPTDPLTLLSAATVLALVSVMASYLPARRAASVDPMVALRYE